MPRRNDPTKKLLRQAVRARLNLELEHVRQRYDALLERLEESPEVVEAALFGTAGVANAPVPDTSPLVKLAEPAPRASSLAIEEYTGSALKLQRGDNFVNERSVVRGAFAITPA